MLREVFARFPGLDGLVVRTGETYLQNVPFHTGNNPITEGTAKLHLHHVYEKLKVSGRMALVQYLQDQHLIANKPTLEELFAPIFGLE